MRQDIHRYNGLLKRLRGRNVLIDIWATWCHPCIGEFAYKNEIQIYLDNKQLDILYISIDRGRMVGAVASKHPIQQTRRTSLPRGQQILRRHVEALGGQEGSVPRYALVERMG